MRLAVIKQLDIVRKYETEVGSPFHLKLKQGYEEYKRREDQYFRTKKRQTKAETEVNTDSLKAESEASRLSVIKTILEYN